MNRKSLILGFGLAAFIALLGIGLARMDGPASRCEGAGGYMLVGPGGEVACIDHRTFLPLEGFGEAGEWRP